MVKRVAVVLGLVVFVFSVSGCATARKQNDMEIQGLKNQISVLESQVQSKDEEINSLKDALSRAKEEKIIPATPAVGKKKVIMEVKSRPNIKQIQIALSNAGYNPGALDGRMGKQTKEAIKEFQKANNLTADGKVGKKTWELLREHLYKKIK